MSSKPPQGVSWQKLDPAVAKRLSTFLESRIALMPNPRTLDESLLGSELGEFWRYGVGGYRLICQIEDDALVVVVVRIGHRREIYR